MNINHAYRKAFAIVGYTYCADQYCPDCIAESMITHGDASPAARDMRTEDLLDQCAGAMAIDRDDERSFDSGEFPKVIFASMVNGDTDRCGGCGNEL